MSYDHVYNVSWKMTLHQMFTVFRNLYIKFAEQILAITEITKLSLANYIQNKRFNS